MIDEIAYFVDIVVNNRFDQAAKPPGTRGTNETNKGLQGVPS
jgi:hypothetical protein